MDHLILNMDQMTNEDICTAFIDAIIQQSLPDLFGG